MLQVNTLNKNHGQQIEFLANNINLNNVVNDNGTEFKNFLTTAHTLNTQSVLSDLIQKFEKQEKIVEKNPSISNIQEYKKIIKEVLGIAMRNYKCIDIEVYSNQGYQKVLNYSNLIDEKLDSIVKDFMKNNKLSLESVSMMDEIKGLLLDIMI